MINYAVDQALLKPFVPANTELDTWNNKCYVSLVGFMFQNTKVRGIKIPFHVNFEEVNLRFYVQYRHRAEWRRGVVFIQEIVPRPAITWVANTIYGEHYRTLPMHHEWQQQDDVMLVNYDWLYKRWHSIKAEAQNELKEIPQGSEAEFITEHYWGYTKQNDRTTSEYGVEHPRWKIYPIKNYLVDVDFGLVYGKNFSFLSHEIPKSVFLAEGSEIKVLQGNRIK